MVDLFDLTGKVALITGSTRGIGLGIAQQFARRGARVAISSRKRDACEVVKTSIERAGGAAIAVRATSAIRRSCRTSSTQP